MADIDRKHVFVASAFRIGVLVRAVCVCAFKPWQDQRTNGPLDNFGKLRCEVDATGNA